MNHYGGLDVSLKQFLLDFFRNLLCLKNLHFLNRFFGKFLRGLCGHRVEKFYKKDIKKGNFSKQMKFRKKSICIINEKGKVVKEMEMNSVPERIGGFLLGSGLKIEKIGLESGNLTY